MKSSGMKSGHLRARRLTVVLILTIGVVAYAGPASAANPVVFVNPQETTLAQFNLMDVWASSSWSAGGDVFVTLNGREVVDGLTNSGGSYVSGDVPVPAGVALCGANEVDWISGGDFITSTTVMVYCPTVSVAPNPVDRSSGTASFTVTGSGYPQFREMVITLDGSQTPINTATFLDRSGRFTYTANIPALPCGTHRLTATSQPPPQIGWERSGPASTVDATPPLPASTTFMVTGCPSPSSSPSNPPPPPPRFTPKIVANPAVITDGTLTHVTGTGFAPNAPVALTWQTPAGATLSTCSPDADSAPALKADAGGKIDTFCYARPHETLGAAQIVATQGIAHAAAPVVVEGGSMQPSSGGDDFIFRR
jgi:hypothetical protein